MLDKGKLSAMAKNGCVTYKHVDLQLTTTLPEVRVASLSSTKKARSKNGSFGLVLVLVIFKYGLGTYPQGFF